MSDECLHREIQIPQAKGKEWVVTQIEGLLSVIREIGEAQPDGAVPLPATARRLSRL